MASALVGVAALVVLLNSRGVFTPDIKPELYLDPWGSVVDWSRSWQATPQLGTPSFNVGLAPVPVVVGLIQALGADPTLSVRILRIVLLVLGSSGMVALARQALPDGSNRWAGVAAAVAYTVNPYVVVAGGTLGVLWPWALLPWFLAFLVRAIHHGSGWRWPAAASLAFAAMTGANAGVVPIMQSVAVPFFVWLAHAQAGRGWRSTVGVLIRTAVLSLALSLYWILPVIAAVGSGATVVANSEDPTAISAVSSWAEVLRGLGLWPLYGADSQGPWLGGQSIYLTSMVVVLGSFAWTVLIVVGAIASAGLVRRVALSGLAATAVLMVGLHQTLGPTPFGWVLGWAFEHVPALGAFRTTNKAGAALLVFAALLVAAGADRMIRARDEAPLRRRGVVVAATSLVLVLATAPAWTGALFVSPMPIPTYWRAAADVIDDRPTDQRVWFLPGQVLSHYRWSVSRPDDLGNGLFGRPTLVRFVVPSTGTGAANYLAAIDQGVQEGSLPPGVLAAAARRLGVGDVVVRNDVVWEQYEGGRPSTVLRSVADDPTLVPRGVFGSLEDVAGDAVALQPAEAQLPALMWWEVAGSQGPIRAAQLRGGVVVVGDGFAFPTLVDAGLLAEDTPFVLHGDLRGDELRTMLEEGGRVVLTDTNRRRSVDSNRLTSNLDQLLPASEPAGRSRTLFSEDEQTLLDVEGADVTATSVGPPFGVRATDAAQNALDGDPDTAWQFGGFGSAIGQTLTVRTPERRSWGRVDVLVEPTTPVRLSSLRLSAGSRTQEVAVAPDGHAVADLAGALSDELSVEVTGTEGEGFNLVGIAEIRADGVSSTRVARLPVSLTKQATEDSELADVLATRPLDVVLQRVRGLPDDPSDDEEARLERRFELPDDRRYRAYGLVRPASPLPENDLDVLAGFRAEVSATSTSVAFDRPVDRASSAVDGSLETAWVPGHEAGDTLTITGPERVLSQVEVTQPNEGTPGVAFATRVKVEADGQTVGEGQVGPGTWSVPIDTVSARTITVELRDSSGEGFVRILEVGSGVVMERDPTAQPCVAVARLDGEPLLARPAFPDSYQDTGAPRLFGSCAEEPPLDLGPGRHRVASEQGWIVDTLVLRDRLGEEVRPARPVEVANVAAGSTITADVAAAPTMVALVLGESFDPRWVATLDGRSLGPPLQLEGWATGWLLQPGEGGRLEVSFGPQRIADLGLVVSGAALVITVALLTSRVSQRPEQALRRRLSRSDRTTLVMIAGVVLSTVTLGMWGAAVAGLMVLWHRVGRPTARVRAALALALIVSVPFAFVLGNLGRWGAVTPQLVSDNPVPGLLASAAVVVMLSLAWLPHGPEETSR